MTPHRYRVLVVHSHPIQYFAPLLRRMAQHPKFDLLVAYCSLQGAEAGVDPEFGVPVAWDVPLLEGYPWVHVPNRSPRPGLGRFLGLVNPGLWKLVRAGGFEAVLAHTGYYYMSYWILAAATRLKRVALLFVTDAHTFAARKPEGWKSWVKPWLVPRIYRLPDALAVTSQGAREFMRSLGIPEERIALTPYVVDNDWWLERSARVNRSGVRASWGVPEGSPTVLFCGKLQPWKRPMDLLRAFARASVAGAYLVIAGDGPLRESLQQEAAALGIQQRMRWLGFVNQSGLPAVYRAADLLVLPSEYEPFGLVVNEAMLCGCAAVVSDRVGCRHDLIEEAETGHVFPCRNVERLADLLRDLLPERARLERMGAAGRRRMGSWSPREYVDALAEAIESAVKRKAPRRNGNF